MKRIYTTTLSEEELEKMREQAAVRRLVLTLAGCSTYTVGQRGGAASILCLCCGLGSNSQGDIVQRYCGFCGAFHSEWTR